MFKLDDELIKKIKNKINGEELAYAGPKVLCSCDDCYMSCGETCTYGCHDTCDGTCDGSSSGSDEGGW